MSNSEGNPDPIIVSHVVEILPSGSSITVYNYADGRIKTVIKSPDGILTSSKAEYPSGAVERYVFDGFTHIETVIEPDGSRRTRSGPGSQISSDTPWTPTIPSEFSSNNLNKVTASLIRNDGNPNPYSDKPIIDIGFLSPTNNKLIR